MKNAPRITVTIIVVMLWSSSSVAALTSTFDSDTEGWEVINGASGFSWLSVGGNPGGRIRATDDSAAAAWFYVSPDSWDGDWTKYHGGRLRYDILAEGSVPNATGAGRIYSGASFLQWDATAAPIVDVWSTLSIDLVEGNFTITGVKTFAEILADVTQLRIVGDYAGSFSDSSSLDNVSVDTAPIPIPAAIWFLFSGLVGLTTRRKGRN